MLTVTVRIRQGGNSRAHHQLQHAPKTVAEKTKLNKSARSSALSYLKGMGEDVLEKTASATDPR
jgi:hypothetical protein